MSPPTATSQRPPAGPRRPEAVDPRIRQRRAEVVRARARRRLRAVLGAGVLLAAAAGAWGVLHTELFSARVVTVVGAVHTPVSTVISAAGLSGHPPLIDVSGSVAGIERLPWVASATVARQWPDGVHITVVERVPVAAVALPAPSGSGSSGGGVALVDKTGRILADVPSAPQGLVELSVPGTVGAPGTALAGAAPALLVAESLPAAFKAQVTEVVEHSPQELTLQLTSPVTVDLGSTVDLHQKFEDVAAILAGATLHTGDVIDVAAPRVPVVAGQ